MKVAEKVILLLNGGDGGVAAAIAGGLQPSPKAGFKTTWVLLRFPHSISRYLRIFSMILNKNVVIFE